MECCTLRLRDWVARMYRMSPRLPSGEDARQAGREAAPEAGGLAGQVPRQPQEGWSGNGGGKARVSPVLSVIS